MYDFLYQYIRRWLRLRNRRSRLSQILLRKGGYREAAARSRPGRSRFRCRLPTTPRR